MRELGFGDVAVNKKMKDFNKILYDILLKLEIESKEKFNLNEKLIFKYFQEFNDQKKKNIVILNIIFLSFITFF